MKEKKNLYYPCLKDLNMNNKKRLKLLKPEEFKHERKKEPVLPKPEGLEHE